jgi:hypothetical protein
MPTESSTDSEKSCSRCETALATESLTFKSQYKETTLRLCDKCFAEARRVFNEFARKE